MIKLILVLTFFSCYSLYANDDINSKALAETQKLLKNPARVQKEALDTPEAKAVDKNASITARGNPQYKQEMYNISADLMPWLVEISKGDPAKMAEIMAEAQSNPAAFYQRMPAAMRAKIKSLSGAIDSDRNKNKSP
ncbi:MAG: hypothetical protein AABY53_00015 [Bdellovibrionota bacterium]